VGRPFDTELSRLRQTYTFASSADIDPIVAVVSRHLDCGLIATGSGGSFTAAAMLQRLHQTATGRVSLALTPLQLAGIASLDPASVIWLLSARGRNGDILDAAKTAVKLEPEAIVSFTAVKGSKLTAAVRKEPVGVSLDFDSPAGKDGFLATNSLLASCILLWRAYNKITGNLDELPTFEGLMGFTDVVAELNQLDRDLAELWECDTIVLLHGVDTMVAALDLESKVMEAALTFLTLSDLRSFGHGRHHWLSRFGDRSGVLVLSDPGSSELTNKTVASLPKGVKSRVIKVSRHGFLGELEGLVRGFLITASLGHARQVDPGRPGIAPFGSTIYHLRHTPRRDRSIILAAVTRKIVAGSPAKKDELESGASRAFQRLSSANFSAIILDLDGTLIGTKTEERCARILRADVAAELSRLLRSGVRIAIATGRGPTSTTIKILRGSIQEPFWNRVMVGYHNGAQVAYLSEAVPRIVSPLDSGDRNRLVKLLDHETRLLGPDVKINHDDCQITLRSKMSDRVVSPHRLFILAQSAIAALGAKAKAVRSSHSVDIIDFSTSKCSVVTELCPDIKTSCTLRIGDSGAWPGNDYELLSHEYGLSVGKVSGDSAVCWNFLPQGVRSVDGTLHYLRQLSTQRDGEVTFGSRHS
jgi:hydroxymethylpyrimidine pyrophosphatase-like HAD family hydrolase/fructoselysine-6-P-deglycase FrlB-like protein